jgi:phosphatidylserine decarboxylase
MSLLYTIFVIMLALILLWLAFYYLWFLRNPKRTPPEGNNIVSPAEGKIVKIIDTKQPEETIEKGLLGKIKVLTNDVAKECYLISIMLTPLDVHFQRFPLTGTVHSITHKKGTFKNAVSNASNLKSTLENEHTATLIKGKVTVKVIQIAGFLARRIHTFIQENQNIKKGELLGVIKLGSQVTLILPKTVQLQVKEGQRVRVGETVIATL